MNNGKNEVGVAHYLEQIMNTAFSTLTPLEGQISDLFDILREGM